MTFPYRKNVSDVADRLYRFYSRQMRTEISAALSYPDPNAGDLPPVVEAAPDDEYLILRESDILAKIGPESSRARKPRK